MTLLSISYIPKDSEIIYEGYKWHRNKKKKIDTQFIEDHICKINSYEIPIIKRVKVKTNKNSTVYGSKIHWLRKYVLTN